MSANPTANVEEKVCGNCEKTYVSKSSQSKYCSAKCKNNFNAKRRWRNSEDFNDLTVEVECIGCKVSFLRKAGPQKYCTSECLRKYTNIQRNAKRKASRKAKKANQRICPHCETQFTGQTSRHKYCSTKCKERVRRARDKINNANRKLELICDECTNTFITNSTAKKYCSTDCKSRSLTRRKIKNKIEREKANAKIIKDYGINPFYLHRGDSTVNTGTGVSPFSQGF